MGGAGGTGVGSSTGDGAFTLINGIGAVIKGGNGGNGGLGAGASSGLGGAAGTGGSAGLKGSTVGGAGGAGGAGGNGVTSGNGSDLTNNGSIAGGGGGGGGQAINPRVSGVGAIGGNGGSGGAGVGVASSGDRFTLRNNSGATITGGSGGNGGAGGGGTNVTIAPSGNGGSGGDGVSAGTAGSSIVNAGTIKGGSGGAGPYLAPGPSLLGGNGGAGVRGASFTLANTGAISGGNGGAKATTPGAGGVGIVSTGNSNITTSGSVNGGKSGSGAQANAVELSGGGNKLTLQAGYSFTGNIVSTSGATNGGDSLVLGTTSASTFDTSKFFGFTSYTVASTGNWTATGTPATAVVPWSIQSGGNLTASITSLGSGVINNLGTLNINQASAGTLANQLSGNGLLTVNTGGNAFNFASRPGSGFAGTLAMQNTAFSLGGVNTTTLTNATLRADTGSTTTVADGNQTIGGLTFNGGTVVFDANAPEATQSASTITANMLDARGAGKVGITVPQPYTPSPQNTPNALNLQQQDDANVGVKLVNAQSTTGTGGALTLVDQNGAAISAAKVVDVAQGGNTVATATYDYGLTTAPGDGLYVNYGLKQLDLQQNQTLTLAENTGASGAAADLSAKLTGLGSLAIDAGVGVVSLSNTTNDYTGDTTVQSGTLRTDVDHALGKTSTLHIANAATANLNGTTQGIQQLDGQSSSTLNVHGGTLNIANGGTSAGSLTGAGQLNVNGGLLDVQGANAGLTANTAIASGATVQLHDAAGLGSGAIADNGTLALNGAAGSLANNVSGAGAVHLLNGANVRAAGDNSGFSGTFNIDSGTTLTAGTQQNLGSAAIADNGRLVVNTNTDWRLVNAVSGAGDLIKQGTGKLTVGDALTYSGKTDVQAGTLIVGDAAKAGVTLGAQGAGTLTVRQGATLAGLGTVSGQVLNAGTVSALNALPGDGALTPAAEGTTGVSTSAAAGTLTLANGLVNSGTVNLAGASVGNQLVVKNGYVGNAGTVVLNTVMGGDNSATDKLVIDSGNASGNTALVIKHAGGNGAQTGQGIRVVQTANGGTTDANAFRLSSTSDGYRSGFDMIASGQYLYSLKRGGVDGVANDWYLTSQIRPEVGSYLSNRLFAQTMQFHSLHERSGQASGLVEAGQGATDDAGAWVSVAGKAASRSGVGGLDMSDTSYIVRAGADVLRASDGGEGRVRVGVMGAYGSDNSHASKEGPSSRGTVDGYNAGVYATWYGSHDILIGPYVDSWVMYGTFNNKVSGQGLPTESYKSSNLAASLEGGYSFQIYQSENACVFLQPQAQVILSSYQANTHTEQNGTVVSGQSGTSVTTRVGMRLYGSVKDEAIGRGQMLPFAELNWWHGPASQSIAFDGAAVTDGLPANRLEGKIGLQGNVSKAVRVWGAVGFEVGAHEYTAGKAQVGLKYAW